MTKMMEMTMATMGRLMKNLDMVCLYRVAAFSGAGRLGLEAAPGRALGFMAGSVPNPDERVWDSRPCPV